MIVCVWGGDSVALFGFTVWGYFGVCEVWWVMVLIGAK
jgi:hypothetical protein